MNKRIGFVGVGAMGCGHATKALAGFSLDLMVKGIGIR